MRFILLRAIYFCCGRWPVNILLSGTFSDLGTILLLTPNTIPRTKMAENPIEIYLHVLIIVTPSSLGLGKLINNIKSFKLNQLKHNLTNQG